jgi:hypothetical protein
LFLRLPSYHNPPTCASCATGILSMSYCASIICWNGGLTSFLPGLTLNHDPPPIPTTGIAGVVGMTYCIWPSVLFILAQRIMCLDISGHFLWARSSHQLDPGLIHRRTFPVFKNPALSLSYTLEMCYSITTFLSSSFVLVFCGSYTKLP